MSEAVSVDLELQDSIRLDVIAVELNKAHREAETFARDAVLRARAAGNYLIEAKRLCKHGEWIPWLEKNFEGARTTAWRYMHIAKRWPELEPKYFTEKHLTVRKALELLSDKPDEIEPVETDKPTTEVEAPKSYISKQIEAFGDKRLEKSFELGDVSRDAALLLGEIKKRGMAETYEALWEHDHRDAQVRKSEPQLKHLLSLNSKGNDDDVTADLVSLTEGGGASSVFEAHKVRQAERAEVAKPKLSDADKAIADRAAQDLVGFDKRVSDEGLADMQRITLELSQTDGWEDLDVDEKQRFIQTQAGEEMAASIKSSRPTAKPPYKTANAHLRALADQYAPADKVAEFVKWWGEL